MIGAGDYGWKNSLLRFEVQDIEIDVLTGVLSEETKLPQPLRISVSADLIPKDFFTPDDPLADSKSYMDLKRAIVETLPKDRHFTLIEGVADHIMETIFFDPRIQRVEVRIVKLALAAKAESIGITLVRERL